MDQDSGRGTGRTTAQMKAARPGAFFVWGKAYRDYPRSLAAKLGRSDLRIVPTSWIVYGARGIYRDQVVVDHDVRLSEKDEAYLRQLPNRSDVPRPPAPAPQTLYHHSLVMLPGDKLVFTVDTPDGRVHNVVRLAHRAETIRITVEATPTEE